MAVKHLVFETERDFSLGYPVDGISELPPWRPEGKLGEIQYRRAGHHINLAIFARADQRQRIGLRRCREQ